MVACQPMPFLRIAAEAEKLAKVGGKVTVTSLDVQTAVSLLVSGDLAKYANAEGGEQKLSPSSIQLKTEE